MEVLWEIRKEFERFDVRRHTIADIFGSRKNRFLPYKRNYLKLNKEQLLQLIREAAVYEWEVLDLSNTGLEELPDELWELTSLKVLYLGNDSLHDAENGINRIMEIPDNIGKLTQLRALSLCGLSNIRASKVLKTMKTLTYLDCFHCDLDRLPGALMNRNLRALGINCKTEDGLKSICCLSRLEELYLTGSQISQLPADIGKLRKLKNLSIASSKVETIPIEMLEMKNLKNFWFYKSSLEEKVPDEIMEQSADQVIAYIYRQQTAAQLCFCNESKVLVVGQGSVGKSCLVQRICEDTYEEKESTEGIAVRKWTFKSGQKNAYTLNIWDFGGQEIYHSTHQFFLTKRSLYIFVWDARAEEEYGRIDYWLKTIESFAGDSPIIIAINKCDKTTTRINRIDLAYYQEIYPQIKSIIEISCRDNININRLRSAIKREARNLPIMRIKWFNEWYQIRMKLENLSAERKYITFEEYKQICNEFNLPSKEINSLSKYLHDLGIILHYEDDILLKGIIILSPEWATRAVYKILDSQETILKNRNGILKTADLPKIWKDKDIYPEEKYIFLLKIMEKFQLCFKVNEDEYLVAELLENVALPMPDNWKFDSEHTIRIVYQYDFMPAGVMTRFIVNANEYLVKKRDGSRMCWKKGAYLEKGRAYASVVMTDTISQKTIEVNVASTYDPMAAKELLSIIRNKLKEINASFNKLSVTELVPCNCSDKCTFKFPYDTLYKAINKGQRRIQCHDSFNDVDILKLLDGIEIEQEENTNSMYPIYVENNPNIITTVTVDSKSTNSQEQNTNVYNIITVQNSILETQGCLQDLADEVEDEVTAERIKKVLEGLDSVRECKEKEKIVKSGKMNKLRRIIEGFASEDGEYHKLLEGSKTIFAIVSSLIGKFNTIADMLGIEKLANMLK